VKAVGYSDCLYLSTKYIAFRSSSVSQYTSIIEQFQMLRSPVLYGFCLIGKERRNIYRTSAVRGRHAVAQWLRYYATSRKASSSILDEVNKSFSIYLIFLTSLGPGVYLASNRNEYQKQKNNVYGK
jgi:hypothetical protein